MYIHVGLDDTDSNKTGMCTTYVAVVLDERIREILKVPRIGYLRLIRLNPACPYKTRGNGAIHALYKVPNLTSRPAITRDLVDLAEDVMSSMARLEDPNTDPALVVLISDKPEPNRILVQHYWEALTKIVELEATKRVLARLGASALWFKDGKGLIGALAAIGAPDEACKTYELLAYRSPVNYGKPRRVDPESVKLMDLLTWPCTYDNVDWYSEEILVSPHTPCPVLLGIRGFDENIVREAFKLVKVFEPIERVSVFKTNQGTGSHQVHVDSILNIKPYTTVKLDAIVESKAVMTAGEHVFIWVKDVYGSRVRVAAYEPTRHFRKILLALEPGDEITVIGSYKPRLGEPKTINLEALVVRRLVDIYKRVPPVCQRCGSKMESMGRGKGYKCKKCGLEDRGAEARLVRVPRHLIAGVYTTPPRAHRHLTKPMLESILCNGAAAGILGGSDPYRTRARGSTGPCAATTPRRPPATQKAS